MNALLILGALGLFAYLAEMSQASSSSSTVSPPAPPIPPFNPATGAATVSRLAQAIATAEGFYVSGSRPARDHNPGDMTADLIGRAVGKDGPFVVYGSDQDGWANLEAQIAEWRNGTSAYAGPDSTIADLADFYTATDQANWAHNVASDLGVSTDTPIGTLT